MRLTVVGTGYVGLVTGACFAEMGNHVTCVDNDHDKVTRLRRGEVPIYEPGLEAIVGENVDAGRLEFAESLDEPAARTGLYFIAVGTPPGEDGSADLRHVLEVARAIGERIDEYTVVVTKSTVPVGTADRVREAVTEELRRRGVSVDFDVVSNPEFLKEGAAVEDFMRPDRVIIGADSERAEEVMRELYQPFMRAHERVLFMGVRDAEMTKYAANAMLATKISFMNEVAGLCEHYGVDVENVRLGIGSDSRIGYSFIYPGPGFGGSCFPKDVRALIHMAEKASFEPRMLAAVWERNERQKRRLLEKVVDRFGQDLSGRRVAVWGLAFKPNTDDMREAPSRVVIQGLIEAGAEVLGYDPVAMDVARRDLPGEWFESGALRLVDDPYAAVEGADAMVLVTEWKPFRSPDLGLMKERMRHCVIFDGRNQYDPAVIRDAGFEYVGIGR